MSRQGRLTLFGATGVAILVALALLLAGGNTAVRSTGAPEADAQSANGVVETGASPTTLGVEGGGDEQENIDDEIVAEPADAPADGGFLLPEGLVPPEDAAETVDQPSTTVPAEVGPSSTSSTSSTSTTSTTVPPPVVEESSGPSVLLQEGWMVLGVEGADPATIQVGTDATTAIAALTATLGAPTSDSGATEDDECAGFTTRRLRFDGLEIVLSERVEGTLTFEQWFVDGDTAGGLQITTEDNLRVGMQVGQLTAVNPAIVVFADAGSASFRMPDDSSNTPVWGRTSGDQADDIVEALWSGNECRRVG